VYNIVDYNVDSFRIIFTSFSGPTPDLSRLSVWIKSRFFRILAQILSDPIQNYSDLYNTLIAALLAFDKPMKDHLLIQISCK
jgi:hypothetical protein